MGASLANTVDSVIHQETRRFNARNKTDPVVIQEMKAILDAEEETYRRDRVEFQEQMRQTREKDRVRKELACASAQLKETRAKIREAEAAVAAKEQFKKYIEEMLGHGKRKGGGAHCHRARMEVMNRLRKVADLSPEQTADWEYFKTAYDQAMVDAVGKDWGRMFSQIVQQIIEDVVAGKTNALSEFMYNETLRVLPKVVALTLP